MNKSTLIKGISLIGFCFLLIIPLGFAWSWEDNGVAICTASPGQEEQRIVSDGRGGAIIAWDESRHGNLNFDIYAQSINSTGTIMWTLNGAGVCTIDGAQLSPLLTSDGHSGAIIVWGEARKGTDNLVHTNMYAQSIDSAGNMRWASDGLVICTVFRSQRNNQIIPDGQGGAIIAWTDSRNGYEELFVQAINSTGSVKWVQDGVAVCPSGADQSEPCMISDGQGGVIIAWHDTRNGNWGTYTQYIKSNGKLQWSSNGVLISTNCDEWGPQIVPDGQGGAIIACRAEYSGGTCFVQSINSAGMIRWKQNGLGLPVVLSMAQKQYIVSDGQGGAILIWKKLQSENYVLYTQAINSTGTVKWANNGIDICTTICRSTDPLIVSDDQGGGIITWMDYRDTTGNPRQGTDIYAQAIDSSGTILWNKEGLAVCVASTDQFEPKMISDGYGGAIISWYDCRKGHYDIYANGVNFKYLQKVENVAVAPGDRQVILTWSNPTGADYLGTKVLRRSDRFPAGPNDGIMVSWDTGTISRDTGLVNGMTYYYGIFNHDKSFSFAPGYFISKYLNWNSSDGVFASPSDTTCWAVQQPANVGQLPTLSWLSSYNGHNGVLKITYSSQTEGIKLTSIARLYNGAGHPWYRLRVQYAADSPNNGLEIISQMLSYPKPQSFTITELGGNWTGNGQIAPNQWYTYDAYVYSQESSQLIQLLLRNNGSNGVFYIDSIQCDSTAPPASVSPIAVPMTIGDFDTAADTAGWAFQSIPTAVNGKGSFNWVASEGTQTGVLALYFYKVSEGVKITSIPTYTIATDRNALFTFKFKSNLSSPTTLHILGYLYGERDVATFKVDLAGKGVLGNFAGNQWNTMYLPLTSVSGNTSFRLQLVIKNNTQAIQRFYLDEMQLYYSAPLLQPWVELFEEPKRMERTM